MKDKKTQVLKNMKIRDDVHYRLKVYAAKSGIKIVDFVTDAIEKAMKESKPVKQ